MVSPEFLSVADQPIRHHQPEPLRPCYRGHNLLGHYILHDKNHLHPYLQKSVKNKKKQGLKNFFKQFIVHINI